MLSDHDETIRKLICPDSENFSFGIAARGKSGCVLKYYVELLQGGTHSKYESVCTTIMSHRIRRLQCRILSNFDSLPRCRYVHD